MDLTPTVEQQAFRDELRAWFAVNDPGPRPTSDAEYFEWRRQWQRRLHEQRWAGVHWPVEFGGRGATVVESAIFFEELGRARAPLPANIVGLMLAGPTFMVWSSPEQQARYLEPILSGDEIWCQGFSEPDAGSDLASVKTRAVRDGDDWVVSGQKVWTSFAQYAKWCILLARTDVDVPKHQGLTYFVLDMEADGVQVRPLRQLTGGAEFNELFLEDVRVPHSAVVGGVNNGWQVAMTTLMNERSGIAFFLQSELRQSIDRLVAELRANGRLHEPTVRERLAQLHARAEVLRLTAYRGLSAIEKYGQPGPEGSLTKWMWSLTNQELTQFAVDSLGPGTLSSSNAWSFELLRARGNSIEGGTTEILKNIVAERVLGLPKGR